MSGEVSTALEKIYAISKRGRFEAVLFGAFALFMAGGVAADLIDGRMVVRSGEEILRSEMPVRYWMIILMGAIGSAASASAAVIRWREDGPVTDETTASCADRR